MRASNADSKSIAPANPPVEAAAGPSSTGFVIDDASAVAWSWRLVALGIAIRLIRYLCVYPIWQDEQFLAVNLLERDYVGLTERLDLMQVAPVGFLLVEKALVGLFGFNEYALRAASLLCGIAGLFACRALAARIVRGAALVLSVGILAVSFFPVRHAAEFKPYAGDLAFSAVLLCLAIDWFRDPARSGRLVWLGLAAIVALPMSYPAIFVIGGISIVMLPTILARRSPGQLAVYGAVNVAILAVFYGLVRLSIDDQFTAATETDFMYDYWEGAFPPPLAKPWLWPVWLAQVHSGEALAYPVGSKNFGSLLSAAAAGWGVLILWRRGERTLPMIAGVILALALVAAMLGRYPYGHGERLQQYWAPFVCIFIGTGAARAIERFVAAERRSRAFALATGGLVALGLGLIVHSHLKPYKHRWDRAHQQFARWFWRFASQGVPQFCITDDLGWRIYEKDAQKAYVVEREIHRHGPYARARHDWSLLPPGSAIECVTFELQGRVRDEAQFAAWMATMQQHYRLVNERVYPVMIDDKPGKTANYRVWRFEPHEPDCRPDRVVKQATTAPIMVAEQPGSSRVR